MKIKLEIDPSLDNDDIVIRVGRVTDEILQITKLFENKAPDKIPCFRDKDVRLIYLKDIEYFYTDGKKVSIDTASGKYEVKHKIYELEELLSERDFVKIEQGVIAQIKKIKNLKMLINGTMQITFVSGNVRYASRRSVSEIKKRLGIK